MAKWFGGLLVKGLGGRLRGEGKAGREEVEGWGREGRERGGEQEEG